MMNVWHLCWIVPVAGSLGAFLMALMTAGAENDIHPEEYHGHPVRTDDLRPVLPGSAPMEVEK